MVGDGLGLAVVEFDFVQCSGNGEQVGVVFGTVPVALLSASMISARVMF